MILTFKFRHDKDVRLLLLRAFDVAVFTVKNKIKSANTTFVKDIRGDLPSIIACQVMKKYGHQKTIKEVHSVNLIVPGQGIKYFEETNSIWIPCLKLHLENTIPYEFVRINQAEIDNEYVYIAATIKEPPRDDTPTFHWGRSEYDWSYRSCCKPRDG